MKHSIIINENDLVYSYKEPWFTGFAPCFQDGLYSLACCKGSKNGSGMRNSIYNNSKEKSIWILSIAGNAIQDKDHNESSILFGPGDALYLAKVKEIYTWKEYVEKYPSRRDAIYTLSSGKVSRIKGKEEGIHTDNDDRIRDCALNYKNWSESQIFSELKQIIVTDEYYIFSSGQKIPDDTLDVNRGFTFRKSGETKRIQALKSLVNSCSFITEKNPFPFQKTKKQVDCKSKKQGGCK